MNFGDSLKALRIRNGMTQADLAEASELGQSTISALETGRQKPWPSTRRALARAFRCSLNEFDNLTLRESAAAPEIAATSGRGEMRFASSKVMQLLEQLGHIEHQVEAYRSIIDHICAACWTTDAGLHVTAMLGPLAVEHRNVHGDFVGRHVTEYLAAAWGASTEGSAALEAHLDAADGSPRGYNQRLGERDFMVFVEPITEPSTGVTGTAAIAIDMTDRRF